MERRERAVLGSEEMQVNFAEQMADLRRKDAQAEADEVERLKRSAWGVTHLYGASEADKIARRNEYNAALDRAERVTSETEAVALLKRAVETGDRALLKAIGYRAATHGWNSILEAFLDEVGEHERRAVGRWQEALARSQDKRRKIMRNVAMSAAASPQVPA